MYHLLFLSLAMYRTLPRPFPFHFTVHIVSIISLDVGKIFTCLQYWVIFMTCVGFLMLYEDSPFQNHCPTFRTKPSPTKVVFHTSQYLGYFLTFSLLWRTQHHPSLHTPCCFSLPPPP
jgi:hypothetical protein